MCYVKVIRQTGHGRQADIWSLGATILEMASGKPPWSEYSSQVSAMFHIAVSDDPPQYPVRDCIKWEQIFSKSTHKRG